MKYRQLGKTGMSVSEVGLGCEHLEKQSGGDVARVIDEALACGVNIFDVFMSEPQVRGDIGKALAGRREKAIIQGHLGSVWRDGQYARSRDINECALFFEDLLDRLQTTYIDIGMLHFVDTEEDWAASSALLERLHELKRRGTVRAVGMSSHNAAVAHKAVMTGQIDVLMFSLNPAYDMMPDNTVLDDFFAENMLGGAVKGIHPSRAALYAACAEREVGITVMKGYAGGALLNAQSSPLGVALTPSQCIEYALTRPGAASFLSGCRSPGQVREAVAYEDASPGERDFSAAFEAEARFSVKGMCVYCNHCLPCPSRIDIAQVNKYLDLALPNGAPPPTVAEHYAALAAHGSDCVSCGQCEPNCPFGVNIMEKMEAAARVFGK